MAVFYSSIYFISPKLNTRKYWWLYIIVSIALVLISIRIKYYILNTWFDGVQKDASLYRFLIAPSVVIFIISLIYSSVNDKIVFEQQQQEKQALQLSSELKFLRSQISPHFLFNVLTNLVSLARKKSDRLEVSLVMLSDLMRYMLYDAQGQKVSLQKEVEYLNSYIALQSLRFGNDVAIETSINLNRESDTFYIEPMLLIPFVENAFKHGTNYSGQPAIFIMLSVDKGLLVFEVRNNFDHLTGISKDESSGIGLANVKSRLELLYEKNYKLTVNSVGNTFHVNLKLKLT